MQLHGSLFLKFSLGVFVLQILLLPLQIVDFRNQFLVLTHNALVVSLMQLDALLELLLQPLHCRLQVRSLFDEFFLLIDAFHLLLVLFLDVFAINLYYLGLQTFVILSKRKFTLM